MKKLVHEWVEKAEEDYRTVQQLARTSLSDFATTICFHAQQCAEKYLKALFIDLEIDPPWIHTLETLLELILSKVPDLDDQRLLLARLTPYAAEYRYPGKNASGDEAKDCVKSIYEFRKIMRNLLDLQK